MFNGLYGVYLSKGELRVNRFILLLFKNFHLSKRENANGPNQKERIKFLGLLIKPWRLYNGSMKRVLGAGAGHRGVWGMEGMG